MRAVVEVNVLISATLSAQGRSAEVMRNCRDGAFELIVSERLIAELTRALAYPKIRKRIPSEKAADFISWVRDQGTMAMDPNDPPPVRSPGPDDAYLLALAISGRSYLVTGDQHLPDSRRTYRSSHPPSSLPSFVKATERSANRPGHHRGVAFTLAACGPGRRSKRSLESVRTTNRVRCKRLLRS